MEVLTETAMEISTTVYISIEVTPTDISTKLMQEMTMVTSTEIITKTIAEIIAAIRMEITI